ncbi:MAG: response regulator [Treponema sp.]|nr:response regulator [Treponema sp.]
MQDLLTQPDILFNLASLILDLLLLFFLLSKPADYTQLKNFRILACTITASAFMGICRYLIINLNLGPSFHYLIVSVCSLALLLEEAIPFLDAVYLSTYVNPQVKIKKRVTIVHHIVFTIFILLMFANVRFEFIIGFDDNQATWFKGPLYIICELLPVYYAIFITISVIRDLRYMKRYVYITMSYAVFLPFLFLILHILGFFPSALVPVGISIGMYIWYFAVENADHRSLYESRKALEEAKKLASDANKAKNIFLANMSHEIRTPMNAVLGLDEMILHTDNIDEIKKYATTIKASGKLLLDIVSNILDFSKLESGKMELMEEEYHFGKIIEHACSKGEIVAKEHGVEFTSDIDQNIPDLLFGAREHFIRIIETLIDVGFTNTKKGSVSLSVQQKKTGPTYEEDIIHIWIQVKDTGMGLPERALSEAFDSFEKLEEDSLNEVEGTGLKLAVVKHLVDLMSGKISIDSVVGVGSTFSLVIPQKQVGKTTIGEQKEITKTNTKPQVAHSSYCAPDAKVLVVDDNNINLIVATGLLKPTRAQVTTCESGAACLEMIKKTRFDIIFLDQEMPDMNGIETLQKAKTLPGNQNRYTPYIALTANREPGLRQHYINEGFTDYISKPIDSSLLYEIFFRNISHDLVQTVSEGGDENA